MHRSRRAVIFRQNWPWRSRFMTVAACAVAACACVGIGLHFGAFQAGSQREWPRAIALSATIPAMLLFFSLIIPRVSMRISNECVQFARTFPCRKRMRLSWHDIQRLQLGRFTIADDGTRRVWLGLPSLPNKTALLLKLELAKHLSLRFDLGDPGLVEFRNAARRDHGSMVLWALVVAHAIGLPIAFASSSQTMLAIIGPLVAITIIILAWRKSCLRRLAWRYPRQ